MKEIELCRILLKQLNESSINPNSQGFKVYAEGTKQHREVVLKLSELSGGIVVPVTANRGRLQTDLSPGSPVQIGKVSAWDTFEETFSGLKDAAKNPGIEIQKWDGINPAPKSGVGSGKYESLLITITQHPDLTSGMYVVPYISILGKGGKSTLTSDKMMGYAAEWAIWFSLGGEQTPTGRNEGFDEFVLSSLEDEKLFVKDTRISDAWANSRINDREYFINAIRVMTSNLTSNLGALEGANVTGNPPTGGIGAVDMIAILSNGEKVDISVKWGDTKRLGGSRLKINNGLKSSSEIFKSVSREPDTGITWRRDKNPIKGRAPIEPSLVTVHEKMAQNPDWENSLLFEAREWLGIIDGAASYAIVQFNRKNIPNVTLPDGNDSSKVILREGKNFGIAYFVDLQNSNGLFEDVLRVELRFTDNKYVQWHKGKNFSKAIVINESKQLRKNLALETQTLLRHLMGH